MGIDELVRRLQQSGSGRPRRVSAAFAEAEKGLQDLARTCLLPATEAGDGGPAVSKFGGLPYLAKGEDWPTCGHCQAPMSLLVQIAGASLPQDHRAFGDGLLQLFYCTSTAPNCEVEAEAWAPGSRATLVRLVTPSKRPVAPLPPEGARVLAARRIVSWKERPDYPHEEDAADLGVVFPEDDWEDLVDRYAPDGSDKLLGWPAWASGLEYPDCPECEEQMELVLQLASRGQQPLEFGDAGTAYVVACPHHAAELAFYWQSA